MACGLLLPSEAQWERACRAGTQTRWFTGETIASLHGFANLNDEQHKKAYPSGPTPAPFDDRFATPAPVGTFTANVFGFHDMHGNVWKWCLGPYDGPYRAQASKFLDQRAGRGGSYGADPAYSYSAQRWPLQVNYMEKDLGLRRARQLR